MQLVSVAPGSRVPPPVTRQVGATRQLTQLLHWLGAVLTAAPELSNTQGTSTLATAIPCTVAVMLPPAGQLTRAQPKNRLVSWPAGRKTIGFTSRMGVVSSAQSTSVVNTLPSMILTFKSAW